MPALAEARLISESLPRMLYICLPSVHLLAIHFIKLKIPSLRMLLSGKPARS